LQAICQRNVAIAFANPYWVASRVKTAKRSAC
jgi:hypothetical protein